MWDYSNYKIIDCHVHACHLKDRASIVFPGIVIPDIQCKPGHIVRLQKVCGTIYDYVCSTCGKLVYSGEDPYIKYNEELIKSKLPNEMVFPVVAISPNIKKDILYYANTYGIMGFKLHPNYSMYSIDLCDVPSEYIYIVHSGTGSYDNPIRILNFVKRSESFAIIAHMGRFNKELFDSVRDMDNVVLDCSPISYLWAAYINKSNSIYDTYYLGKSTSPEDLLSKSIHYLGVNKVVYGSDIPIDSQEEDLNIIKRLPDIIKNKILSENLLSFISNRIRIN